MATNRATIWPSFYNLCCGDVVTIPTDRTDSHDDTVRVWREHGAIHVRRAWSPVGRLWEVCRTYTDAKRTARKMATRPESFTPVR